MRGIVMLCKDDPIAAGTMQSTSPAEQHVLFIAWSQNSQTLEVSAHRVDVLAALPGLAACLTQLLLQGVGATPCNLNDR